jgi:ABC-type transporter MlaC component
MEFIAKREGVMMYKTGTKISWVWGKVNMMETGEYWLDEQQAKEHAETLRQRRVSALMRELERLQAVK